MLRLDREAVGGRRGVPVLAALAVIVLVALTGAYVLMQGSNSELAQFGHYKAQGDSLFAVANYMEAKTQYEYALAAAPNNEYVEGRLTETQQRLAEVEDIRYDENMAQGDTLYTHADSLLNAGDALGALSSFAEANKAYYEALRYKPNDPTALEKGRLTTAGLEEALRQNGEVPGQEAEAEPDPAALRQQLYNSYRQQGDDLLARGDYAGAREKYNRALQEVPGDTYVLAKIREIEAGQADSGRDQEFEQLLAKGEGLASEERYAEAKIVFRQALDIKPDEQRALTGLNRASAMLEEEAQRDEEYQTLRSEADTLAGEDKLDDALASYKQALIIKPGDAYIQGKVKELQKTIADRLQAQEAAEEAPAEQEEEEPEPAASIPAANVPSDGIYAVVEEAPELLGGLKGLHSRVNYPRRARQLRVEGRVYVQFVVTETGQVQDATVIRGVGGGCDEEALRVVKEARFVPGKMSGQPVKVRHTLFITFRLEK